MENRVGVWIVNGRTCRRDSELSWSDCPRVGVVQVESKLFYLDLKENTRGRYLKVSEKGNNRERSTIIVPCSGIPWFVELFHYYAGGTNETG